MKVYVKCDRCGAEGAPVRMPTHRGAAGGWGQGYSIFEGSISLNDGPPTGWSEASLLGASYLLCPSCASAVEGIIRGALKPWDEQGGKP